MALRRSSVDYKEQVLELVNLISDKPIMSLTREQAFAPLSMLLHSDELHHKPSEDKSLRLSIIQHITYFRHLAVAPLRAYLLSHRYQHIVYSNTQGTTKRQTQNHLTFSHIMTAKELGSIGGDDALSGLILAMQQDHLGIVLREIANSISKYGSDIAIPILVEVLLSHPDKINRKIAAITLGKFSESESVTALILALQDDDADVTISAVQSLGKIKSANALPFLIEAINDFRKHSGSSGAEIRVSEAILNTVHSYQTKTTDEIVLMSSILHLTNEIPEVKCTACFRLGELGDSRAIQALTKALNDKSKRTSYALETVSKTAQIALKKIGTSEAYSALSNWQKNNP